MKLKLTLLVCLLLASLITAQTGWNAFYQAPAPYTTTGPDNGPSPQGFGIPVAGIGFHELIWTVTGAPASCTVALDSSPNGSTWTAAGAIANKTCTSNGNSTVTTSGPFNYVRINVVALSGGATLSVEYYGWVNNPSGGVGLADPGANGIVKRTALNTTAVATSTDIIADFTGCSGTQYLGADGACHNSAALPSAASIGQVPVSTSAGTTYAAQDKTTWDIRDAVNPGQAGDFCNALNALLNLHGSGSIIDARNAGGYLDTSGSSSKVYCLHGPWGAPPGVAAYTNYVSLGAGFAATILLGNYVIVYSDDVYIPSAANFVSGTLQSAQASAQNGLIFAPCYGSTNATTLITTCTNNSALGGGNTIPAHPATPNWAEGGPLAPTLVCDGTASNNFNVSNQPCGTYNTLVTTINCSAANPSVCTASAATFVAGMQGGWLMSCATAGTLNAACPSLANFAYEYIATFTDSTHITLGGSWAGPTAAAMAAWTIARPNEVCFVNIGITGNQNNAFAHQLKDFRIDVEGMPHGIGGCTHNLQERGLFSDVPVSLNFRLFNTQPIPGAGADACWAIDREFATSSLGSSNAGPNHISQSLGECDVTSAQGAANPPVTAQTNPPYGTIVAMWSYGRGNGTDAFNNGIWDAGTSKGIANNPFTTCIWEDGAPAWFGGSHCENATNFYDIGEQNPTPGVHIQDVHASNFSSAAVIRLGANTTQTRIEQPFVQTAGNSLIIDNSPSTVNACNTAPPCTISATSGHLASGSYEQQGAQSTFGSLNVGSSVNVGAGPPTACNGTSGCVALAEAAGVGTPAAGVDYMRADTSHLFKFSLNNGAEQTSMASYQPLALPNLSIQQNSISDETTNKATTCNVNKLACNVTATANTAGDCGQFSSVNTLSTGIITSCGPPVRVSDFGINTVNSASNFQAANGDLICSDPASGAANGNVVDSAPATFCAVGQIEVGIAKGDAGSQGAHLIDTHLGDNGAAGAAPPWSSILASTINNTPVNNANFNTTQGCTLTGATDCFDFSEVGSASTGTGAELEAGTKANSTAVPFKISQASATTVANPGTSPALAANLATGSGAAASSGTNPGGHGGDVQVTFGGPGTPSGTLGNTASEITNRPGALQLQAGTANWVTGTAVTSSGYGGGLWKFNPVIDMLGSFTASTAALQQEIPQIVYEGQWFLSTAMKTVTLQTGGTSGFTVGDILVVNCSSCGSNGAKGAPAVQVTSVSGGVVTGIQILLETAAGSFTPGTVTSVGYPRGGANLDTSHNPINTVVSYCQSGACVGIPTVNVTAIGAPTHVVFLDRHYPCQITANGSPNYSNSGDPSLCHSVLEAIIGSSQMPEFETFGQSASMVMNPQAGGGTLYCYAGDCHYGSLGGNFFLDEFATGTTTVSPFELTQGAGAKVILGCTGANCPVGEMDLKGSTSGSIIGVSTNATASQVNLGSTSLHADASGNLTGVSGTFTTNVVAGTAAGSPGLDDLSVGTLTSAMGAQSTATCTNVTNMTWNVAANKNYKMHCVLPITFAASATISFCIGGPGTPTSHTINAIGSIGAAGVYDDIALINSATYGTKTAASGAVGASSQVVILDASIRNGATASGTALTLQTAANGTNNITMLADGVCELHQTN